MLKLAKLQSAFRHADASYAASIRDPREMQGRVSSLLAPHEMEVTGTAASIGGALGELAVGDTSLVMLRYGSHVTVRPAPTADHAMLQFIIAGSIEVEHDGHMIRAQAGDGLIIESLGARRLSLSSDCEQLIVPMLRSVLARAMERISGRPSPGKFGFDDTFTLTDHAGQSLLALIHYLMTVPRALGSTGSPAGELVSELIAHHLILNYRGQAVSAARSAAVPYYVLRAEQFMRHRVHLPLKLADIAAHSGVSVRTLSMAFRRFRGVSPMEWLRDYRLDLVRTRLCSGDASTVAHSAAKVGFAHAGRFSRIYNDRFGEKPHVTIANARSHDWTPLGQAGRS